jgi:hypothetical protein
MGFTSIFYGNGNKPYTASYEGSSVPAPASVAVLMCMPAFRLRRRR